MPTTTINGKNRTSTRLYNASKFELNARYLMALQQCGAGENDAAVYATMLVDLAVTPIRAGWLRLEEEIGLEEILLGEQIIGKNIDLEKAITMDMPESAMVEGSVGLSVQGDTR